MPELDEKREEAIVESVLFTMGKSVELRQLAAALGTDTERADAAVRRLQSRYEAEKRGMQITQLEDSWQMATIAALATIRLSCSFWELYMPGSSATTSTSPPRTPVYAAV